MMVSNALATHRLRLLGAPNAVHSVLRREVVEAVALLGRGSCAIPAT
jgi:hypothetical protein